MSPSGTREDFAPIFGMHPTYFYGYQPSNGSVWLWWWMAPSHSELYANLAFFLPLQLLTWVRNAESLARIEKLALADRG